MSTIVTLNLAQGTIKGERKTLEAGREHYKFFGIPYAKSPIGQLRFKNPQPLERFPDSPLDCTKLPNASMQMNKGTEEVIGSEDCLYLNIHTPQLKSDKKLPVLVWIHGGSFLSGYGNRHILYPKYLMEENVVIVSVNYRVGALGFLSLPSGGISGNFGLKDQQMALKWVAQNIHQFNGDPSNVTLMGQSAGGCSVHYQLMSKESRKYFHKVICMSGLATMEWALEEEAETKALRLAEALGCKGSPEEIANFYRNLEDPGKFILNTRKVFSEREKQHLIILPFVPVVESESEEDPFLTRHPLEIIKTENIFENIPVMMGYTSKEGIMVLAYSPKSIAEIDSGLSCMLPLSISSKTAEETKQLEQKLRDYYFSGKHVSKTENLAELCELLGDINFIYDTYSTVEQHAIHQPKSPLYFFKFSYDGRLNMYKKRYGYESVAGACHGDELYHIFYPNDDTADVKPTDEDLRVAHRMCKLWTNFAKFGNPTPERSDGTASDPIDFVWKPTNIREGENFVLRCLDIDAKCQMVDNPDFERVQFWRKLMQPYVKRSE